MAKGEALGTNATQPCEGRLSRVTGGDERSEPALDRRPSRGYLTESLCESEGDSGGRSIHFLDHWTIENRAHAHARITKS